uniref:Uncharacterized protein n=1 Tax=Octopus bimaculoides TaxID=37653 RepID=A0A0L8FRJ7_OCTBM
MNKKYKMVNDEMITELMIHANEQLLQNVIKLWKDDCLLEEINSLQQWENNINFFLNYESQFKRDYTSDNTFLKKSKTNISTKTNNRTPSSDFQHRHTKLSHHWEINHPYPTIGPTPPEIGNTSKNHPRTRNNNNNNYYYFSSFPPTTRNRRGILPTPQHKNSTFGTSNLSLKQKEQLHSAPYRIVLSSGMKPVINFWTLNLH